MRPIMEPHPRSLLAMLGRIPDVRRRQGREYPLGAVLGMLVLAAINGETSLRGMYLWAKARWTRIWAPLGFLCPKLPAPTTVWTIIAHLDEQRLEAQLADWNKAQPGQMSGQISVDGKTLRGTRRRQEAALHIVEAVGEHLRVVLQEQECAEGEEFAAALALLREIPLEGRVVSADAGLLHRELAQTVLGGGGDYLGVLKENHPQLKAAVDEWVRGDVFPPRAHAQAGFCATRQRARANRAA